MSNLVKRAKLFAHQAHLNRAIRKSIDRKHLGQASAEAQLVKVIDRIDNLRDMEGATSKFKQLYATESLQLVEVLCKAPQKLRDDLIVLASEMLEEIE